MTKREKRLEKIRQNPKNVTFDELRMVLEDYGFEMRPSSGTSHYFFRAEIRERIWTISIPYKRPHLKAVYVKDALIAIDEITASQEHDDE